MMRPPPSSTLFPYTTLFRSLLNGTVVATAAIRVDDVATTHLFYSFSLVAISAAGFGIGMFLLATSAVTRWVRSEEHTSELQSHVNLVCRLLLEKKKTKNLYN